MKKNRRNTIFLFAGASLLIFASSFKPFEREDFIRISQNISSKGGGCPLTQIGRQSGGMDAYTGSVPDGTNNGQPYTCALCHSGGSTTPTINMTVSPAFTNNTYVPGQTYTITYNVSGYSGFGFDFEINDGNTSSSSAAGTFSSPSSNCQIYPASAYPANVSHNQRISSSNSASFQWTAPTSASNSLYLFSVGLGVNANGSSNGDQMASRNLVLTAASGGTTGIETYEMNNFEVYPNPATDLLNIQFTLNHSSIVSVDLIGINGEKVTSLVQSTNFGTGDQKLNFSLGNQVSSGIYFLQIKANDKVYRRKVIIK